jgi:hypothetical protein
MFFYEIVNNIIDNFVATWDRSEREAQAGMKTDCARMRGVEVVRAPFIRPSAEFRFTTSFRERDSQRIDCQRNVGRLWRGFAPRVLWKTPCLAE